MKKRSAISIVFVLFLSTGLLKSQTGGSSLTDLLLKGYEPKMMTDKPVTDSELNLILKCGLKAVSARNRQLWKFTVVKEKALLDDVIPNFTPGNILIIISGQETPPEGSNVDIDCGIATAFMLIGAQSLGLAGHVYGGPVNSVNLNKRSVLQIPEGYKAITLLRIGNFDNSVDAISAASTRKSLEEVVNYR
jgi:nitroreductase